MPCNCGVCMECDWARNHAYGISAEEELITELQQENASLRTMLWGCHGHDGLYGDDGEQQCNIHGDAVDFKRDPIERIEHHIGMMIFRDS